MESPLPNCACQWITKDSTSPACVLCMPNSSVSMEDANTNRDDEDLAAALALSRSRGSLDVKQEKTRKPFFSSLPSTQQCVRCGRRFLMSPLIVTLVSRTN